MSKILLVLALVLAACAPSAPNPPTEPLIPTIRPSSPQPSAPPAPFAKPRVEKRIVAETVRIPFQRTTREDGTVNEGRRYVETKGVDGIRKRIYEVTIVDGKVTSKVLTADIETTHPQAEVVVVGTKVESRCDPNYSGCVPIARDVDCAGGRGDGPAYVRGPVEVVGYDIYDLDGDGDGIGCE